MPFDILTSCFRGQPSKPQVDGSGKKPVEPEARQRKPWRPLERLTRFLASLKTLGHWGKRERTAPANDPMDQWVLVGVPRDLKGSSGDKEMPGQTLLKDRSARSPSEAGRKNSEKLIFNVFYDRRALPPNPGRPAVAPFADKEPFPNAFLKLVFEQLCRQMPQYHTGELTEKLLESAEKDALRIYEGIDCVKGIALENKLRKAIARAEGAGDNFDIVTEARKVAIEDKMLKREEDAFVLLAARNRSLQSALDLYKSLKDGLDHVQLDHLLIEVGNAAPNKVEELIASALDQVKRNTLPP